MQTCDDEGPTPRTLQSLLRGELSAVHTYEKALEKLHGAPAGALLRRIFADHSQAVGLLRDLLIRYECEMPTTSSAWGSFADGAPTSDVLGDPAALRALKAGEEHGIRAYQRALGDPALAEDARAMSKSLMERCQAHVPVLDALLGRP